MTRQTVEHAASIAAFGAQASGFGWPRTDLLLTTDADVLTLLKKVADAQNDDFLGLSSLDLDADQAPTKLYAAMADLATGAIDQRLAVPVRWVHPDGAAFTTSVAVIGMANSITMEGKQAKWTATLRTAKAAPSIIVTSYTFSTTTTDADPGNNHVRFNNATQPSTTIIYLDLLDAGSNDLSAMLDAMNGPLSSVKGYLQLFYGTGGANNINFNVMSVTTASGYRKLVVQHVSHAGSAIPNNQVVTLQLTRVPG